jgi:hypothetical protein
MYGVDPRHAAAPSSYQVGSVISYCVTQASTLYSSTTLAVSLSVPSLVNANSDCLYAIINVGNASAPLIFYGNWVEQVCVAGSPAWQLTSWTLAPPSDNQQTSSGLPPAAGASIGVLVPLAVIGIAGAVWVKRRRSRHTRINPTCRLPPVTFVNPFAMAGPDQVAHTVEAPDWKVALHNRPSRTPNSVLLHTREPVNSNSVLVHTREPVNSNRVLLHTNGNEGAEWNPNPVLLRPEGTSV